MRNRCWAAALGDCEGRITAEHPISQAIFESDMLTVRGPVWPEGDPELPLPTFAGQSLCKRHNGLLSADDSAIGQFARKLRQLNAPGVQGMIEVDGWALERWCVKALIGIVASGWHRSNDGHRIIVDAAPIDLAEAAFGRGTLSDGRGLNVVTYSARIAVGIEAISWKVLVANAEASEIVGFLVALPPIALALQLLPGDIATLLRQITLPQIDDWTNVAAHYRPSRVEFRGRESDSHIDLRFDWSRRVAPNAQPSEART
jgi:hypothetical protein